ncbi:hypothetical protein B0T13DRAFT_487886 [Neurospora crassa]|nr:hypothetical protein B0T13DRAFT_487886 [Neurospora crassa]
MPRDAQNAQDAQILRNLPPHVAMTTNGLPDEGFGRKDKWEVYGNASCNGVNLSTDDGAWGSSMLGPFLRNRKRQLIAL